MVRHVLALEPISLLQEKGKLLKVCRDPGNIELHRRQGTVPVPGEALTVRWDELRSRNTAWVCSKVKHGELRTHVRDMQVTAHEILNMSVAFLLGPGWPFWSLSSQGRLSSWLAKLTPAGNLASHLSDSYSSDPAPHVEIPILGSSLPRVGGSSSKLYLDHF